MSFIARFWKWYERYYAAQIIFAAFLFIWQLVHLYWLTTHVVSLRLFGISFFNPSEFFQNLLIFVDYTEIPALIGVSLVYIYALRQKFSWKDTALLVALNSQWIHILWITDEFVVNQFISNAAVVLFPLWFSWVAICIDYLELPVMFDTVERAIRIIMESFRAQKSLQKI